MKKLATHLQFFLLFFWHKVYLFFYLARKHFLRNAFSSIGLFLTLVIVFISTGLFQPMKKYYREKMIGSLPKSMIKVQSPQREKRNFSGFLTYEKDASIGIPYYKTKKLRSMKEVEAIYYTQVLQSPMSAQMDSPLFSEFAFKFDLIGQGISSHLVKPYLRCMKNFQPSVYKTSEGSFPLVPVVIPQTYADIIYAYSMVNGLPSFKKNFLTGLRLKITMGSSVLGFKDNYQETIYGKICGFMPEGYVKIAGFPLGWVEKFHREKGKKRSLNSYDSVFLRIRNVIYLESIKEKIRKMGLIIPEKTGSYQSVLKWMDYFDYLFWGTGILLMALSFVAMINAFSLLSIEKKYEFGLFLVFGSSPVFIWILMFLEGALWGMIHSVSAILLSEWMVYFLQANIEAPISAGSYFSENWGNISLQVSSSFKISVTLISMAIAGITSFLPAFLMMRHNVLSLIKKD